MPSYPYHDEDKIEEREERLAIARERRHKEELSYQNLAETIANLVDAKQAAYGDAFNKAGKCLEQLFPNGVKKEQYTDLLCIVRILDKLFRIANEPDAFGESPFGDIVGYGLLGMKRHAEHNYD